MVVISAANPYSPPQESSEKAPAGWGSGAASRLGRIWDLGLASVFLGNLPSMVRDSWSLLFERRFDLIATPAKLPERWILAFFLLSISYYLARPRGAIVRLVYAGLVASFLFQHRTDFGDVVTDGIVAIVFFPVLVWGFGWLGVMHAIAKWIRREFQQPRESRPV